MYSGFREQRQAFSKEAYVPPLKVTEYLPILCVCPVIVEQPLPSHSAFALKALCLRTTRPWVQKSFPSHTPSPYSRYFTPNSSSPYKVAKDNLLTCIPLSCPSLWIASFFHIHFLVLSSWFPPI